MKNLNRHAPIKKKLVRVNEVPYMTKVLTKAIMKRSELESKYLKNKVTKASIFIKAKKPLQVINYIRREQKLFFN